ncbi:MAG: DUF2269 domain-containing protein [Bermanella sp.]
MDNYLILKLLHILSATVLLGTGAGIAFFMLTAYLSKSPTAILVTCKNVITGDWLFTTPAIITQVVTGVLLMEQLNYAFNSAWFLWVLALFVGIGLCWLPVVRIQYLLNGIIKASINKNEIPDQFHKLFRVWFILGIPAFFMIIGIFYLMVFKPFL